MDVRFIITSVNGVPASSAEELNKILNSVIGIVRMEGMYLGYNGTYTYLLGEGYKSFSASPPWFVYVI